MQAEKTITVVLGLDEYETLKQMAHEQHRSVRGQAAVILEQSLRTAYASRSTPPHTTRVFETRADGTFVPQSGFAWEADHENHL